MAVEFQVTIDAADPDRVARLWAEALGYVLAPAPGGFATWDEFLDSIGWPQDKRNDASALVDPDGKGPRIYIQRVPEHKVTKNRLHLDLRAAPGLEGEERMAALEKECERLIAFGAVRVQRFEPDMGNDGFIVMQDPEGNEFCLD